MRAVVLRAAGGPEQLVVEQVATPPPRDGEVLVRVHAAALTRDELEWAVDRLPAIPSYELSGVVVALGPGVDGVAVGDEVYGMTAFDRDGVAADYAAIPTELLAPKRVRSATPRRRPCRSRRSAPGRGCSTTAGSPRASGCSFTGPPAVSASSPRRWQPATAPT